LRTAFETERDDKPYQTSKFALRKPNDRKLFQNPEKTWLQTIERADIVIGESIKSICSKLFDNFENEKFTPRYMKAKEEFKSHLDKVVKTTNTSLEGHSGQFKHQHWFYWTIGKQNGKENLK
jgi:hypothetical protein